ncbi:MAG: thioredoxin domain-containing protein [Myxococcota bacterium]|nr:thioredoxin domain-containing protein [Myxococcota bacterium]
MRITLTLGACGLALAALACQDGGTAGPAAQPSAAPQGTTSVAAGGDLAAEVNGVAITTAELDQWIKDDWFANAAGTPSKLYEMRSQALDALIAERLVTTKAQEQGIGEEELIRRGVEKLGSVTDEEVEAFFNDNQRQLSGATLEQVGPRIREFLASRREGQARAALLEEAEIVMHLEVPRVDVLAIGPAKGPEDARITIVEFSDFECPFCRRVIPTLDAILEKYPGDVRVVYRNMPLRNHQRARPAAEAALCANEQGKFWAYHDRLFENTRKLGDEDLLRYAEELELDAAAFSKCYEEKRFAHQVETDMEDGARAGVSGTPAFFVNGIMVSGAKPAEDFFRIIDAELERLDAGKG